jgi:hypothetical protein
MRLKSAPFALSVGVLACGEPDRLDVFSPPPPVAEVACASGPTWSLAPLPKGLSQGLGGIWGATASDVWAVGGRGTVLHFDGAAWTDQTPDATSQDLYAVHGSSAADVWAVGLHGAVLHYEGTRWSSIPSSVTADLVGVFAASPDQIWFAASDGPRRSENGSFAHHADWPAGPIHAVWASSSSDVWMVGDGAIHHFDGTAFHTTQIAQAAEFAAVGGVAGSVFAIGHSVNMRPGFASLGAGGWTFSAAPPRAVFFSMWAQDAHSTWIGANDTSIFRRTDQTWCRESIGGTGGINAFFSPDGQTLWAVGATRSSTRTLPLLLRRS